MNTIGHVQVEKLYGFWFQHDPGCGSRGSQRIFVNRGFHLCDVTDEQFSRLDVTALVANSLVAVIHKFAGARSPEPMVVDDVFVDFTDSTVNTVLRLAMAVPEQ